MKSIIYDILILLVVFLGSGCQKPKFDPIGKWEELDQDEEKISLEFKTNGEAILGLGNQIDYKPGPGYILRYNFDYNSTPAILYLKVFKIDKENEKLFSIYKFSIRWENYDQIAIKPLNKTSPYDINHDVILKKVL